MPLVAGTRLGPYEIVAPLGAGGMGEVYRARDTRLGREIALKVLPDDVAADPARRQRFEQEARAVSALNHPNILSIYDVGSENGVVYMVSELVEGESAVDEAKLIAIREGKAAVHPVHLEAAFARLRPSVTVESLGWSREFIRAHNVRLSTERPREDAP